MNLSPFILACFFLSGLAGLIYEVLWVRMIDKVIGSAPFAVATVLAVFMGGLSLGSYLAGRRIDRILEKRKLLSLYGKLEVAIGLYGLMLPIFMVMVKPAYSFAYNHLFQSFWIYSLFTFFGCTLLLIPPTSLMGATLPILCRFYVTHLDHLGARTGLSCRVLSHPAIRGVGLHCFCGGRQFSCGHILHHYWTKRYCIRAKSP
jgi:spermidine synthase